MKVLIVGSGGREHAIGWKLAQSPRQLELSFAPGNAGTAQLGENLPVSAEDVPGIVQLACERQVDLVVVGPEVPLALGLADSLLAAGIAAFGPVQAAAQLESSKAFAKAFMRSQSIPTAGYETFTDFEPAAAYLRQLDAPVVIKASGLAAGKGVILPDTTQEAEEALRRILLQGEFGAAGSTVVIEERLEGQEVSVLAFTDGLTLRVMPPAQDHKRLLDGDRGPNTGGMGAFAPAAVCPAELVEQIVHTVLQPAVDGMRQAGTPFAGVLYAGLMLTASGPQVLEFNCRFGDPEAQVILPLLGTDLLEIMLACTSRRLSEIDIQWLDRTAACIVLASENYPGKPKLGRAIQGLEALLPEAVVFHAGTRLETGQVLTAGGRVLSVSGWGKDLRQALATAYAAVQKLSFEGMQYRKDIGWRALLPDVRETPPGDAPRGDALPGRLYKEAGVNIDAGNQAVELMTQAVRSTYGPEVLAGIGAFGGLYDASALKALPAPVLVASTDGVGTKVKLAAQFGRFASLGQDIVNHCINDILVQGARPLFFLDYFATSRLSPEVVAEIVGGVAAACRLAGCALLGGETAEMPGVYAEGEFDVAGTVVGLVDRSHILPREDVKPGDVMVGLASSGPHTNGYSLIRKVFADTPLDTVYPDIGVPLWQALLEPHRSYLPLLYPLLQEPAYGIKALSHITGGGFIENIPRVLPEGTAARLRPGSWPVPAIFQRIQSTGNIPLPEMARVFNLGIGMVVILDPGVVQAFQQAIGEETWVIGELVSGERKVVLA